MTCDHEHNETAQCDTCYNRATGRQQEPDEVSWMTSVETGVVLFWTGMLLMSLGLSGLVLHRWGREFKQLLPRYEKGSWVDRGDRDG